MATRSSLRNSFRSGIKTKDIGNSPLVLAFSELARSLRDSTPPDGDAKLAWETGDLSYKYWDVQKRMAKVLNSEGWLKKVLNCSRRIRKTSTALIESCHIGLKKKNALMRYAAPTREMLVTIIEPIMQLICEDAPAELIPVWHPSEHHYLFPSTGAKLFVSGCDDVKAIGRLRGRAADLCVVDEAQEITHLKYLVDDVLMPQLLGVEGARGPLWILLTPPKTPIHECRQYVMEAEAHGTYAEFNVHEGEYPQDVVDKFCQEAGGPESTTWLREYMCQFIVDKNFSIVPEWKQEMVEAYVPNELYRFYQKYEGLDIGVRHLTVNLYGVYDFRRGKLFVQDESVLSGPAMTTQALADLMKAKEKELWPDMKPHLRIADNNNLVLLQDLGTSHGIHVAPTSKDTLEAMVNNIRLWVGQDKLRVDPKCEQLIGCLKYAVWNNPRTDWDESSVYGHFDALAALMYMLRYIDVTFNPIPRSLGINEETMFVPPKVDLTATENTEAIRRMMNVRRR